jgi:L-alanine-DL-glutamate epimerase-like enolase superfamily enzyme
MMDVEFRHESWPIAGTFTISRGSKTKADVIVVTLKRNGHKGWGEAVPYPRYGETVADTLAALQAQTTAIAKLTSRDEIAKLALPFAARNALDCALWDLECKESNMPAWQRAGLPQPQAVTTAFTISLDTPDAMAKAARAAAERPLLKVKLGRDGDQERLAAVRKAAPRARLIIDANEGWTAANLEEMLSLCAAHGVELVEQPLPASDDEALRSIKRPILVCADESAHGPESLENLRDKYDAINIKLDKTGGLTPALALAKAAQSQGFKIMVGCMLATSLAMAPAFFLAHFADYIDLDGPLILLRDREPAITYTGSLMQQPPRALWG